MADVRALLRQQRQSRRIEHLYAAYSDAGKLLCTLCREQIRAESQWESHIRSTNHQRRAVAAEKATEPTPSELSVAMPEKVQESDEAAAAEAGPEEPQEDEQKPKPSTDGAETRTHAHKRKISDSDDADEMDLDDAVRRKRSRANISVDITAANGRRASGADRDAADAGSNPPPRRDANRTPPTLARRMSSTPSRGVELQIPSRPATPAHRDSSSSSTPGGSTLTGLTAAAAAVAAHANAAPSATNGAIATDKLPAAQVDEDEWAAFEAEMAATAAPYADDAVISAPAMTAEESAAAAAVANGEDGNAAGSRKSRADLDIEGEREDATRALEDEFDDMQELEARVKRLKEKREELRKRTSSIGQDNGPARLQSLLPDGDKSHAAEDEPKKDGEGGEDEDDDDDDDEEDDWDGFRFRK